MIFHYATVHNEHGFNGDSMSEAFDSTNTSLFAGLRSDAAIVYAADSKLYCSRASKR
jgi:hypothetical protein